VTTGASLHRREIIAKKNKDELMLQFELAA
jgi:hypothetical protein